MSHFRVRLMGFGRVIFEGRCVRLSLATTAGPYNFEAGHMPWMGRIRGVVVIHTEEGEVQSFDIRGEGICLTDSHTAVLFSRYAVAADVTVRESAGAVSPDALDW